MHDRFTQYVDILGLPWLHVTEYGVHRDVLPLDKLAYVQISLKLAIRHAQQLSIALRLLRPTQDAADKLGSKVASRYAMFCCEQLLNIFFKIPIAIVL